MLSALGWWIQAGASAGWEYTVAYVPLFICLQNMPYVDRLTYVDLCRSQRKMSWTIRKGGRRKGVREKRNPCGFDWMLNYLGVWCMLLIFSLQCLELHWAHTDVWYILRLKTAHTRSLESCLLHTCIWYLQAEFILKRECLKLGRLFVFLWITLYDRLGPILVITQKEAERNWGSQNAVRPGRITSTNLSCLRLLEEDLTCYTCILKSTHWVLQNKQSRDILTFTEAAQNP